MFSNKKNTTVSPNESNNIIGKGTCIEGNLKTVGNIRVEGVVKGEITTQSKLVLAEEAHIQGNTFAKNAEIGGKIEGNIHVYALLVLKKSAVVSGDITTHRLVCEEGAQFNGKCLMQESKKIQTMRSTEQTTITQKKSSFL